MGRFFRFLVTGGLTSGVNVVRRRVVSLVTVLATAVVAPNLIAMNAAFLLPRLFVFDSSAICARNSRASGS